jgi:hypothetical protein
MMMMMISKHDWLMFAWFWQTWLAHFSFDLANRHVHTLLTWHKPSPGVLGLINMSASCLLGSGKHDWLTFLLTWLTATSTHSWLGTSQVQVPWVWQTCPPHVYLGLASMPDPCWFGLRWPPSPGVLGLTNMLNSCCVDLTHFLFHHYSFYRSFVFFFSILSFSYNFLFVLFFSFQFSFF